MKALARAMVLGVVLSVLVPAAPAVGGNISRCGAVTLDDRPKLGQTENWDYDEYQRRHNRYQERHPEVFASGYLAGKHFYVGFTKNVCWHLKRFRKGLSQKWRARAFLADWTFRELRRAQGCANEHFDNKWLDMQGTGVDVWRNKLEVMFKRNTERRREYIERRCGTVDIRFTEGEVGPD